MIKYRVSHERLKIELNIEKGLTFFFLNVLLLIMYILSNIDYIYFFIIDIAALIIFWKDINSVIGFIFAKVISKLDFYLLYLYDESNTNRIKYENSPSTPLREYIKDSEEVSSKRQYFIGTDLKDKNTLNQTLEIIGLNNIFNSGHNLIVHFVISLLIINILYTIMMVLIYSKIQELHITKEIMIVVTSLCFTMTLIIFILFTTPISKVLSAYKDKDEVNHGLENKVEIWEYFNGQVKNITLDEIVDAMFQVKKNLDATKSQIMQITTPILYLTHITILMSYFT